MLPCVLAICLAGCIIIPAAEHGLMEGRGMIEPGDTLFMEEGTTRRDDVLLRFGEPDLVVDQDRVLVYHWSRVTGYVFVGAYYSGTIIPLEKQHYLVIEFDDTGRVQRFELTGRLPSSVRSKVVKGRPGQAAGRELIVVQLARVGPAGPGAPPGSASPPTLAMGEFRRAGADGMADNFVGHKKAAFGVIMGDVVTPRPVVDMVRSALAAQLEHAGYAVVPEGADLIVTGDAIQFGVTTPVRFWSWDAVASLDVTLRFHCASSSRELLVRRYQSSQTAETTAGPSNDEFRKVARACLQDVLGQLAADAELHALLRSAAGRCH